MPKAKYDHIYKDLKEKIETEFYAYQQMLPSENAFVKEYGCSRNTVRRALAELTAEGYVQPMHGKGVRNIFQPVEQTAFTVGGIESFKESAARNKKTPFTRVLQFAEVTADEKIERRTGFKSGTELYYIQRLRSLDGKPLILDHNYFLKELTEGLTPEIAASSVYEYLENVCGITISTSKRTLTVEHVTQVDETYIDLKDYNCMVTTEYSSSTHSRGIGRTTFCSRMSRPETTVRGRSEIQFHYVPDCSSLCPQMQTALSLFDLSAAGPGGGNRVDFAGIPIKYRNTGPQKNAIIN